MVVSSVLAKKILPADGCCMQEFSTLFKDKGDKLTAAKMLLRRSLPVNFSVAGHLLAKGSNHAAALANGDAQPKKDDVSKTTPG